MIATQTSPADAIKAAKQLVGLWPHAKPEDPEVYVGGLASVLAQYPLGLVHECVDPRRGLAREREFPPTVACIVEWCDRRLQFHQTLAKFNGLPARREEPDYSPEHRTTMLQRLSKLMHDTFDTKRVEAAE